VSIDRITQIGVSLGWVEGDLDGFARNLAAFAEQGAEVAEIYASAMLVASAGRIVPSRMQAMQQACRAVDITITIHAPIPINFMDRAHADLHWRAALLSLDMAAALDAPVVVFHAGCCSPKEWLHDAAGLLAYEREQLHRLGEAAAERDTRAALENISPNKGVTEGTQHSYSLAPAELAVQLSRVEHPGLIGCLDISHAWQGAHLTNTGFLAACEAMGPLTGHIHISDSEGLPVPNFVSTPNDRIFFGVGDMHAPLGWGSIDFDAVAERFKPQPGTLAVLELGRNVRHQIADNLAAVRSFAAKVG